jgi:hypothetical protein
MMYLVDVIVDPDATPGLVSAKLAGHQLTITVSPDVELESLTFLSQDIRNTVETAIGRSRGHESPGFYTVEM